MMKKKRMKEAIAVLAITLVCIHPLLSQSQKKPNVLFIAIDDLRPELGAYGSEVAVTPHLDALASQGLLFDRAYCQQAICSPSRASVMTGARPESIGVIENYTYFRDLNPDLVTLPQHFIQHGYQTVNVGKIYHGAFNDAELSWSRLPATDRCAVEQPHFPGGYVLAENQEIFRKNKAEMIAKYGDAAKRGLGQGPAYECADVPDTYYVDGYNTQLAIATIRDMLEQAPNQPFFMGLGYYKPHLDWLAPKKYWDLYDEEKLTLASHQQGPIDGAAMGLHPSFELRVRAGIPKAGDIGDSLAHTLKHAYLACVSYVDAQIGTVLEALDEAGVRDNTIIVVWSDHGWHLGDMGIWGKATNYEVATRVPLMIWTPEMRDENRGVVTEALVELVDLYPTLCELVDIALPSHLEGQSLVPLLEDPHQSWKETAFSQFPTPALREWAANPLSTGMRETYFGPLIVAVEDRIRAQQGANWDRELFENNLMGYAMRTDRYRLILWKDRRDMEAKPLFVELYDHKVDSDETINVAEEQPEVTQRLMALFDRQWSTQHKRK